MQYVYYQPSNVYVVGQALALCVTMWDIAEREAKEVTIPTFDGA